jgi:hypothetical protein
MTSPVLCQCCDCHKFIPDTIGFGIGIGNCKYFEAVKAMRPRPKVIEDCFVRMGNKVLYGGRTEPDRYCEFYEAKP